jgi:1-acyl-sn-glycerol-3-phosphate acyltransferase
MLVFLRSLFFYFGFFISLLVSSCLCLLIGPFLSIQNRYRFFPCWNHFIIFWLKLSCSIKVRVTGKDNIPPLPVVIISNHQSPWETIFLYYYFSPVSAILKKELLRLPFFGWALSLLKPIAIDRKQKFKSRRAVIEHGKERLNKGISVLIFPEGTRVPYGEDRTYQSGGATLSIEAGVKLLPVAHNAGLFWPSGKFLKRPGTIDVVIGPAIETQGKNARELTRTAEHWIKQAL